MPLVIQREMPAPSIFSADEREYIRVAYLQQRLTPASIVGRLNTKFGTTFTLTQVQRLINKNWSQRLKTIKEREAAIFSKTDSQIVRDSGRKHTRTLNEFAEKSRTAAHRALDLANKSGDARSLSAAASAAKSLITTFRVCAGLEGIGAGGPKAATFNFNFGNIVPARDADEPAAVDVQAVTADHDDEDAAEGDPGEQDHV